ncbi:MAG: hypothetical protein V2B18_23180, partial [Pseudomonadota bacterium]
MAPTVASIVKKWIRLVFILPFVAVTTMSLTGPVCEGSCSTSFTDAQTTAFGVSGGKGALPSGKLIATADNSPDRAAGPPLREQALTSSGKVGASPTEDAYNDFLDRLENILRNVEITGQRTESRTYDNKMFGGELMGLLRVIVVLLVIIVASFPVGIWFLIRDRVLGSSSSMRSLRAASILVQVEERQAKLANILRDIQNEIDYLHSLSGPDLKRLIEQAERY